MHRLSAAHAWGLSLGSLMMLTPAAVSHAQMADFTTWAPVYDPPNGLMSASSTTTQATLTAGNGPIGAGTDVGFASVNGSTVADSTAGHAFSAASDFMIAVDYDLSFAVSPAPLGVLSLGFGVGTDVAGANSAGMGLYTWNGSVTGSFGAAAVTNDGTPDSQLTGLSATPIGSLFVQYEAATGTIIAGASPIWDDPTPDVTVTYTGLTNAWPAGDLLASFFIRSDDALSPIPAWQSGEATAVFRNYRILEGTPTLIPEPATGMFALLTLAACTTRRRRAAV